MLIDYIEQCKQHINIIRDVYEKAHAHITTWPEQHLYSGDWSAIGLKYNYTFTQSTPLDFLLKDASIAMFSILKPNTIIKPHAGHVPYSNHIRRYHFCIQASEDNYLFVGNDIFEWKEGEGFTFDDSKIHYGWNKGTVERVVLLFDIPIDLSDPPPMAVKMDDRFTS